MRELIASGAVVDTETLQVNASVYYGTMAGEEDASGEAVYEVVLRAKNYDAGSEPVTAVSFDEIAEWCGEMVVPGYGENEDVALEAPVAIRYAKTKAFEMNGKTCVFASLRYTY